MIILIICKRRCYKKKYIQWWNCQKIYMTRVTQGLYIYIIGNRPVLVKALSTLKHIGLLELN